MHPRCPSLCVSPNARIILRIRKGVQAKGDKIFFLTGKPAAAARFGRFRLTGRQAVAARTGGPGMRPGTGPAAARGTGVEAAVVLVTVPRAGDREIRHHRGDSRQNQQGGDERCHGRKR